MGERINRPGVGIGETILPPSEDWGPALRALKTDQQRRFAFLVGIGACESNVEAARLAGYGGSDVIIKGTASQTMQSPKVIAAIEEVGREYFKSLAPRAIMRARAILDDPKHRHHGRMIETILDRTGYSAKTEHKVTVEHTVDMRELERLAARLAVENGIDPRKFIGLQADPKLIEGEAVKQEVSRETSVKPSEEMPVSSDG